MMRTMRANTFLVAFLALMLPLRVLAFVPQLHCAMGPSTETAAASSDCCPSHDEGRSLEHDGCDNDPARGNGCSGGACCPPVAAAHSPPSVMPPPEARPPLAAHRAAAERTHVPPLPERPPSIR
jgi:hypothetical protein